MTQWEAWRLLGGGRAYGDMHPFPQHVASISGAPAAGLGQGGQRSQVHPGLFPGLFPRQAEGAGSSSQSPPPGEGGWVCQADGGQGLWP